MSPLGEARVEKVGEVYIVSISGEIDLSNAEAIRAQILPAIPNSAVGIVVDFTATRYLDSAGIRLIFELRSQVATRRQQLALVVSPASPILDVLEIAHVPEAVPVHATREEALAATAP